MSLKPGLAECADMGLLSAEYRFNLEAHTIKKMSKVWLAEAFAKDGQLKRSERCLVSFGLADEGILRFRKLQC